MAFRSRPSYYGHRQSTFTVGQLKGVNLLPASFRKFIEALNGEMKWIIFLCIHGTLHSNMLSLYFTFALCVALTLRLWPFLPSGKQASGDKDRKQKKGNRQACENDSDWLE